MSKTGTIISIFFSIGFGYLGLHLMESANKSSEIVKALTGDKTWYIGLILLILSIGFLIISLIGLSKILKKKN